MILFVFPLFSLDHCQILQDLLRGLNSSKVIDLKSYFLSGIRKSVCGFPSDPGPLLLFSITFIVLLDSTQNDRDLAQTC